MNPKMLKALDESCDQYVNQLLFFDVHYGWGWHRTESDAPSTGHLVAEAPPDFHMRACRFYQWQGVLRGAVCKIEEPNHPYDGFWAVFCTRPLGTFNLTDNLTTHNVQIGPDEPVMLDPSEDPELAEYWPLWQFSGSPQLLGYGVAAVSPEHVKRWEDELAAAPLDKRGLEHLRRVEK